MIRTDIKATADRLARRYGTRDPFQIARDLGYIVLRVPLSGLRGFYRHVRRCHIIYVNDELDEVQARLVCAHELGHRYLHQGMNRMFMDRCTRMVTGRYELEAHRFSVDLLYDDEELQPFLTRPIDDAAAYMGVHPHIAAYRLNQVLSSNPQASADFVPEIC